ncbi:MAG: adenosylcobalamin-dependent ribonucleoside-diphosphate reductase [Phycisphaerales bacterium]|nr:MAG: adenosylcobalamin-dependent ribonucleoside-diphosphate reductase [Phycisphaerales bacterium]
MKVSRRFTTPGQDVYATVQWTYRDSRITNADGSVVFEMTGAEVPEQWSQLATDIMVSKYFRKAGVPQFQDSGTPVLDEDGRPVTGPERSVRQVVHRLAGCWRAWGEAHNYFDGVEDADAFYDELAYMLLHQIAAPNSPQWFNTGLNWACGISGPPQGHWICDPETGKASLAPDAYSHPQPHACFIQSISDDLVNAGGIMDLWTREARLFKYGSGTGTNFSPMRGEGEPLSGGGRSSGLMSFLKIGDRAAGAIKSGGTTRRAAKMVTLDADHPDIEQFVNWKVREELKVAALVEGMKHLSPDQKELADNLGLRLDYDFNGEAYYTVSGQNSNNSVRLTGEFFKAVEEDGDWHLIRRTDREIAKTLKARDLWNQICQAAWRCADPGLQFDTTINAWHTCPNAGRINASNPCSEYMFLDDTACNLASINVLRFYDPDTRTFDVDGFEHAINLWTVVLEISVLMASYPSRSIAEQSYRFRTLGLGIANLGAMLMQAGIPYNSDEGRATAGTIAAILTGRAYAKSAEMAGELTPFAGFSENREAMLRVIRNHRRAAYGVTRDSDAYEGLQIKPMAIDHELFEFGRLNITNAADLLEHAKCAWEEALTLGERFGFRNAQVSVIAPTGTIGLLMDCDTTGVEPDFALVKFKKLAGGGHFKIANASLRPALKSLGYLPQQIDYIHRYVMGTLSLDTPMPEDLASATETFRDFLLACGYRSEELVEVENRLPQVFELRFAFTAWSMPEHVLESLEIDVEKAKADVSFNGLIAMGLSERDVEELNRLVCGTQTVEGAPHIKEEHLPVFDCANKCGASGRRFIAPEGHIRMMAAAQPFVSGAISKTINIPSNATVEDVAAAYRLSWELGLKANALYRDGCKLSQPLNTRTDAEVVDAEEDEEAVEAAREEVSADVALAAASAAGATEEEPTLIEQVQVERIVERIVERPLRRRLPDTRQSTTHHFNVAGHEGYLTVGVYDNGAPGELFITMSKEGSTIGGLMDSLGTAISVALQYGVPIDSLVNKFAHQRFEPMGMTANRDIPFAKSLVDYIFRWLGMEFIPGYREANAPQRSQPKGASEDAGTRKVKEDRPWSEHEAGSATPGAGRLAAQDGPDHVVERDDRARTDDGSTPAHKTATCSALEEPRIAAAETTAGAAASPALSTALDQSNASLMGDAPACDECGMLTVRNGSCYKCTNCGNSMGCS